MQELIQEINKINSMEVVARPFPTSEARLMSIYTTAEVAEQENCQQYTVDYWCRNNQVKKLGKTGIFIMSLEDVEAFRTRAKKGWPKGKARK